MHRFSKRIVLGLAVVAVLLCGNAASADQRGGGKGLGFIGVFRHLNLTPEQITQVNSIISGQAATLQADKDAVHAAKAALKEYLRKGGSDSVQIGTLTDAIGKAAATLNVSKANTFVSAYSVLTPEQKTMLANYQKPVRVPAQPADPAPAQPAAPAAGGEPVVQQGVTGMGLQTPLLESGRKHRRQRGGF